MYKRYLFLFIFSFIALVIFISPLAATPVLANAGKQHIWTLIMGISQYPFLNEECNGGCALTKPEDASPAANNACALYELLCSYGLEEQSKLLLNENATKYDIYYGVKWLADHAGVDDTVILYFSGLGLAPAALSEMNIPYYTLNSKAGYIAPYESGGSLSSQLDNEIPYLYRTWYRERNYDIAASELSQWLDMLSSPKVLIILDMNYAGSLGSELSDFNRVVMMSSDAHERSLNCTEMEYGVFTTYILEALQNPAVAELHNDHELSAEELFFYAQTMTAQETIFCNGAKPSEYLRQHPVIADLFPGNFPLLYHCTFSTDTGLPAKNVFMTIDGQEYCFEDLPLTLTWAAGSSHDVAVAEQIDSGHGTRVVFTTWDDGYDSPVRSISSGGAYKPLFKTQYYLSLSSRFNQPFGEGWYDSGSQASFSVKTADGIFIRRHFTGWSGDYSGRSAGNSLIIDTPKSVNAEWETNFTAVYIAAGFLVIICSVFVILVKRGKILIRNTR